MYLYKYVKYGLGSLLLCIPCTAAPPVACVSGLFLLALAPWASFPRLFLLYDVLISFLLLLLLLLLLF